jgi:hypothetical protein
MNGLVIGLITPLFEPLVQVRQRQGGRKKGEKLHSQRFEKAFNFTFSFRAIRGAMDQGDAERGGGMSELVRTIGRPIVDVDFSWESSFAQRLDQTIGQVSEVFLQIELSMGNQTGMVIQKGKEKTFSYLSVNDHRRPMHAVGLPEIIGQFGFIPSEIRFKCLRFVEPSPLEEPIEALNGGVKVGR